MPHPALEVAEIFRTHGAAWRAAQSSWNFRRPANPNAADHRKARAWAFTTWAEVDIAAGL